jgi:hypothetical protein
MASIPAASEISTGVLSPSALAAENGSSNKIKQSASAQLNLLTKTTSCAADFQPQFGYMNRYTIVVPARSFRQRR